MPEHCCNLLVDSQRFHSCANRKNFPSLLQEPRSWDAYSRVAATLLVGASRAYAVLLLVHDSLIEELSGAGSRFKRPHRASRVESMLPMMVGFLSCMHLAVIWKVNSWPTRCWQHSNSERSVDPAVHLCYNLRVIKHNLLSPLLVHQDSFCRSCAGLRE